MVTVTPSPNASTDRGDRVAKAIKPSGTTADTSPGYLHAIAPPAIAPTISQSLGREARATAQMAAAW